MGSRAYFLPCSNSQALNQEMIETNTLVRQGNSSSWSLPFGVLLRNEKGAIPPSPSKALNLPLSPSLSPSLSPFLSHYLSHSLSSRMSNSTYLPEARTLKRISLVLSLVPGLSEAQKQEAAIDSLKTLYKGLDPLVYTLLSSITSPSLERTTTLSAAPTERTVTKHTIVAPSVVPLSPTDWFDTEIDSRQIDLRNEYSWGQIQEITKHMALSSSTITRSDLELAPITKESTKWRQELTWRFFTDKEKLTSEQIEYWDSYHDRLKAGDKG